MSKLVPHWNTLHCSSLPIRLPPGGRCHTGPIPVHSARLSQGPPGFLGQAHVQSLQSGCKSVREDRPRRQSWRRLCRELGKTRGVSSEETAARGGKGEQHFPQECGASRETDFERQVETVILAQVAHSGTHSEPRTLSLPVPGQNHVLPPPLRSAPPLGEEGSEAETGSSK